MSGQTLNVSITDDVMAQAAQWIVLLSADNAQERINARAEFESWKQADVRHAEAAMRMEAFIGKVQDVNAGDDNTRAARAALDAVYAQRQKRGKAWGAGLAIAFVLMLPAWLGLQIYPPALWFSDHQTSASEWQNKTLADGSQITLNGASAVNLHFDTMQRVVELVQGEILVEVAHDAARPFRVETVHGHLQALGTRFVVSVNDQATVLTMLESEVEAGVVGRNERRVIHAGQQVSISTNGFGAVSAIDPRSIEDAWRFHQLVARGEALSAVLDTLDRHRPGVIHYDRDQLQGLQVSAVLSLDDTDRALELLIASFPDLRVRTLTPYLTLVDAPGRMTTKSSGVSHK